MPTPTPPYQFIAIARTIARGFTERLPATPMEKRGPLRAAGAVSGTGPRDGMDTPAVAKFAARIRMFDRVIASASLTLSNLPDDNHDRHAVHRATIDSMAEVPRRPLIGS
jgi:hypothetical protein